MTNEAGWRLYPGGPDNESAPYARMLLPHFIVPYMKALRNAYDQAAYNCETGCSWGWCAYAGYYRSLLDDQIDYVLTEASRFGFPATWDNVSGYAQGLEQADMARFLASVAMTYAAHGDDAAASTVLMSALGAIWEADWPIALNEGGVRSERVEDCGATQTRARPCYWFHSRGRGIDDEPYGTEPYHTVLNQNLHVIRELLEIYVVVQELRPLVVLPYFWETTLMRLAVGSLYQLAFSNGNNSVARDRPPNLEQFMDLRAGGGTTPPYYWAFYEFDMPSGQGANISGPRTCLYHFRNLQVFYEICQHLAAHMDLYYTGRCPGAHADGWRLYEAVDRLLDTGGWEAMGTASSPHALWQFFLSANDPTVLAGGCSANADELTAEARDWYVEYWLSGGWYWWNHRPAQCMP